MSAPAQGMVSLLSLDPAGYESHEAHSGERSYHETNCYSDILIELMHARGDEPLAAMGFILRMDFEGDQWTFFKPDPTDMAQLFGIDVHEMQPYRDLPTQVAEQLAEGRTMTIELDSMYLPDTEATAYRTEHVKTSVVVEAIDPGAETLRYFHNTSLHELSGEDYRAVFRRDEFADPAALPPYTELVRFDAGPRLSGDELRAAALEATRRHLAHRPDSNPFTRFSARLAKDLPQLLEGDAAEYHAYAFATVRMAGSAFELGVDHVEWLLGEAGAPAAAAMSRIVDGCKILSFKLARRKPFDPEPAMADLATAWDEAMSSLEAAVA